MLQLMLYCLYQDLLQIFVLEHLICSLNQGVDLYKFQLEEKDFPLLIMMNYRIIISLNLLLLSVLCFCTENL